MTSAKIKAKAIKDFLSVGSENLKYFQTALAKKCGMTERVSEAVVEFEVSPKELYESITLELARQYIEICRLLKNYGVMRTMQNSAKQQYYRRINMSRHLGYMDYALDVLQNGKDDQIFNEKLKEYNDYIESHIEREGFHKTFRTISKQELKEESKKSHSLTIEKMKERNINKYNEIGHFFFKQCTGKVHPFSEESNIEK